MLKLFLKAILTSTALLQSWLCFATSPNTTIKLGMSVALSGPASHIGQQLKQGHELYFNYANREKRPGQPHIKLLVLDDGYEPSRAVDNTHYLIKHQNVDALIGNMGTPTTHAIKDILKKHQLPLLMPYTGAEFLYQNPGFPIFKLRASYLDEAKDQVKYLVEELGHKNIALFIQADEFGLTLEKSHRQALKNQGIEPVVIARFRRNTNDVAKALTQILTTQVTAIAMIGTYEPLSAFINQAYRAGFRGSYTSVSFVSSASLFEHITVPANIMVTEVLPDPQTCQGQICALFRAQATAHAKPISYQSFEGFVNAYLFTTALQYCKQTQLSDCISTAIDRTLKTDPALQTLLKLPQKNTSQRQVYRSYLKY
ncbi:MULTISPECIES: ABC transporter substrate-binding protein [Pseudoalteromonas]|uniref:ABC-type branched-chain amino acid transport system, periplasmic component n=1 Tax=Pseudoalteromonas luteoviolacea (strain 2ta16) TaxID=1353533 RepID=V4H9E7_PSEL2|nr:MULTISPECIES: ABC transporter substrate-binding protein [Pseudoalteromonas]ESP94106.1 ABC-type branched-chain amino acid transport system, periplasmic component [Pseudoalteromonas luteoviolacea 2ta16]KZN42733.1 hypothetical protein N483_10155 [Pseudoalteromonas luteoviolacea NCIMB 1944]MCG7549755.1 ABC transporter substrate-binding protein [Pseudoalteromonas sp. Of7M-16]